MPLPEGFEPFKPPPKLPDGFEPHTETPATLEPDKPKGFWDKYWEHT